MDDGEKRLPAHGELATEPYWPLEIVLQWLMLRSYRLLAEVNSRDDGRSIAELNATRTEGGLLAATVKHAIKGLGPGDLDPRATLLAVLRRGVVKAHDHSSLNEPRLMNAIEWGGGPHKGGLRIYFEDGKGAPYAALARKGTRVERVLIDRASVLSEFPALEGQQEIHTVACAPTTASQWTSAAAWDRECGEAAANPPPKKDKNSAEPSTLAEEIAAIAPTLKIKATMRLKEKIELIEEWFKGERRIPPGRTTIKDGLKLAGLNNPRQRGR